MWLRALALRNFKSFEGARIEFSKGINAIVGANGSGKSNLCDALLFCFGESSLKALRVKRGSDLITGDKPSAEVKIVLVSDGNASGTSGAGSASGASGESEVAIVRTIVRDGRTKYWLRGKRAKKYVVEEWLASNGIRLSSVIRQGEVARIVEMNAKERRTLIDEIANISTYEAKKAEALAKLEDVEARLRESSAALAEKAGYLSELKREKEAAERWLSARRRAESARATLLTLEAVSLEAQFEECIAKASELSLKQKEVEECIAQLGLELQRLGGEKEELSKAIYEKSEGRQAALQEQLREYSARAEKVALLIEERQKQCSALESELSEAKDAQKRALLTTEEKGREVAELEKECQSISNDVTRLEHSLSESLALLETRSQRAAEARKIVAGAQEELLAARERLSELQASINAQNQALQRARAQLQQISTARSHDIDQRLETLQKQRHGAEERLQSLKRELSDAEQRAAALSDKLALLEEKALELRTKVAETKAALSGSEALRAIASLKCLGDKELYGALGELCTFEKSEALAIEAALGQRANYFVVASVEAAQRCITYLKQHNLGRLSFIPLNAIQGSELSEQQQRLAAAHGAKPLINLLTFDNALRRAFAYACGDTLVVQTMDDAKPLLKRFRIATREGEIFERSALITGGSAPRASASALAAQQLKATEQELSDVLRSRSEVLEELRSANSRANELRERVARATLELKALEIEEKNLIEVAQRVAEESEAVKARATALVHEIEEIEGQIATLEGERAEAIRRISALNLELLAAKEALDEEALANIGNEVKRLEHELAEKRIAFAKASTALAAARASKEASERALLSESRRCESLGQRLALLEQELQEHRNELQCLAQERERVSGELKSLSDKLKELIDGLASLEGRIAEIGNAKGRAEFERDRLQRERSELEQRRASVERSLAETRARLSEPIDAMIARFLGVERLEQLARQAKAEDGAAILAELKGAEAELRETGAVNLLSIEAWAQREAEFQAAKAAVERLRLEKDAVLALIREIEAKKRSVFLETFEAINANFSHLFKQIFDGEASLVLESPHEPFEGGLTIRISLAHKPIKYLEQMSGGEKSFIALLFILAIQSLSPTTLYIFDEADAALDAENSHKLMQLLRALSKKAQFIVVTHNEEVYKGADALIGVAMSQGKSSVLEVRLARTR